MAKRKATIKVYDGPSLINGQPINLVVGAIERPSSNRKTGPLAQCAAIPADHPTEAIKTGADESVCGECAYRPSIARKCAACGFENETGHKRCRGCGAMILSCYVRTGHGPGSQWRATRDSEVDLQGALDRIRSRNRSLRLGEWGSPSAAPLEIIEALVDAAHEHTAYEHQVLTGQGEDRRVRAEDDPEWQRVAPYLRFAMASAETEAQAIELQDRGFRTYRVGTNPIPGREIECPHYTRNITCDHCGLCDGTKDGDKRKSIVARAL